MRLTTLIPYFASVVNDDDHPLVQERRGRLAFKARREGLDADLAGRDPVPLKRRDRGAGALVLHADAARGIGRLTEEPADFDERRRTRRGAGDCVRHDGPAARRERGSPPFRLGQVEDLELGGASREQRGEGERGKGRSSLQKRPWPCSQAGTARQSPLDSERKRGRVPQGGRRLLRKRYRRSAMNPSRFARRCLL